MVLQAMGILSAIDKQRPLSLVSPTTVPSSCMWCVLLVKSSVLLLMGCRFIGLMMVLPTPCRHADLPAKFSLMCHVTHPKGCVMHQGVVKSIREKDLTLSTGEDLPYGLCVWSTGVGPTDFTTSLPFAKSAKGRIAVDDELRVLVHPSKEGQPHGPTTPADVRPLYWVSHL